MIDRQARGGEQGAHDWRAAQAPARRVHGRVAVEVAALDEQRMLAARDFQLLAAAPARETLLARRQTEADQIDADERCARAELDARVELGDRAVEQDRLVRQPFQRAAAGYPEMLLLVRGWARAAVVLGGGRRGDDRVRAVAHLDA